MCIKPIKYGMEITSALSGFVKKKVRNDKSRFQNVKIVDPLVSDIYTRNMYRSISEHRQRIWSERMTLLNCFLRDILQLRGPSVCLSIGFVSCNIFMKFSTQTIPKRFQYCICMYLHFICECEITFTKTMVGLDKFDWWADAQRVAAVRTVRSPRKSNNRVEGKRQENGAKTNISEKIKHLLCNVRRGSGRPIILTYENA